MQLLRFTEAHIDAAARLLAGRHRRQRMLQSLLPAEYESLDEARKAVEQILTRGESGGYVAVDGGAVVGYLIGTTSFDAQRLRHAWVHPAGHAVAKSAPASAEVTRDLYARLAADWVREGLFAHYALVPAHDREALEPWYSLGFGQEQAHALMAVAQPPLPAAEALPGITVRRAGPDDLPLLLDVADLIGRHLAEPPCFGVLLPESRRDWAEGWAEVLGDPAWNAYIALRDGKVAAHALFGPANPSLLIPAGCVELKVAAARPEERGRGLVSRLIRQGLHQAWQEGSRVAAADWRTANLSASRVFPRMGFTTTYLRLVRAVDPRIAWANQ